MITVHLITNGPCCNPHITVSLAYLVQNHLWFDVVTILHGHGLFLKKINNNKTNNSGCSPTAPSIQSYFEREKINGLLVYTVLLFYFWNRGISSWSSWQDMLTVCLWHYIYPCLNFAQVLILQLFRHMLAICQCKIYLTEAGILNEAGYVFYFSWNT